MLQLQPVYFEAVDYLKQELSKLGLPQEMVDVLAGSTGVTGKSASVSSAIAQFPKKSDAVTKFSVEKLAEVWQQAITESESGKIVTNPDINVLTAQLAVLHELIRLFARKKRKRVDRILLASHRRLVNAADNGRIHRALVESLEEIQNRLRE